MTTTRRGFLASAPAAYLAAYSTSTARPKVAATDDDSNVIFVTTDGLRWQEVFRGADEALLNKEAGGVADIDALRREFWRDSLADRREALLPFLWKTFVPSGQLFGNLDSGCEARVTNGKNFSYPGYNELLTGAPDPRVDSNDKRDNANVTVLEWLNRKPAFQGRVAASCTWDSFLTSSMKSGAEFPPERPGNRFPAVHSHPARRS